MSSLFTVLSLSSAFASIPPEADIDAATNLIFVTVENTSESPFAAARSLEVTSDAPFVTLSGDVRCGENGAGTGELVAVGAVFEEPAWFDSTTLWNPSGASVQLIPEGNSMAYPSFGFDYTFPTGGEEGLISLGLFQPAKIVESDLQAFVANGGTAEDYLREDRVIEVPLTLYLTATCAMPSNWAPYIDAFHDSRSVTAYVLHAGDPTILDPLQVVVPSPDTILAPQAPTRQRPSRR